jgi:hypothetical protein
VTSISKLDIGEWKEPGMDCSEMSAGRKVGNEGSRPVGSCVVWMLSGWHVEIIVI